MHTTQIPALYHCILPNVTVLRPERPQVRILSAAPRAAPFGGAALFCLYEILREVARVDPNSCAGARRLRWSTLADNLPRRQDRLFGDSIQRFARRRSLRSLPLRGRAAVAESEPRPRGGGPMKALRPVQCHRLLRRAKKSCGLFLGGRRSPSDAPRKHVFTPSPRGSRGPARPRRGGTGPARFPRFF